jgi:hypothetical protein
VVRAALSFMVRAMAFLQSVRRVYSKPGEDAKCRPAVHIHMFRMVGERSLSAAR